MTHFDKDLDTNVNIEEFLEGIRGRPNDVRQDIVDKAFAKFDKENTGFIDVRDLK